MADEVDLRCLQAFSSSIMERESGVGRECAMRFHYSIDKVSPEGIRDCNAVIIRSANILTNVVKNRLILADRRVF
ncbi:hypothetical protein FZX15_01430 [Brucella suis bv. 1]|nr:hypothetical protein FZX15_01430 [Brucella suis bv. 1]